MDNCEFYLLYSGGYDSTVLLYDFIDKLPNKLTVIHIVTQYNQEETKAARKIIELVKDKILNYIELEMPVYKTEIEYIPYRNAQFILRALSTLTIKARCAIILLGLIKVEEPFPDCTQYWLKTMEKLVQLENPHIGLEAPYINNTKDEIYTVGCKFKVPLRNTFSCNFPVDGVECGECGNCKWKAKHKYPNYFRVIKGGKNNV